MAARFLTEREPNHTRPTVWFLLWRRRDRLGPDRAGTTTACGEINRDRTGHLSGQRHNDSWDHHIHSPNVESGSEKIRKSESFSTFRESAGVPRATPKSPASFRHCTSKPAVSRPGKRTNRAADHPTPAHLTIR